MEPKMQSQRLESGEISTLSARLVSARGANAAQRAAKAPYLAPLLRGPANEAHEEAVEAEAPVARRPGDAAPRAQTQTKPTPKGSHRRFALIGLAAVVALAVGGWYGHHWFTVGRFIVSTDDAYVRADATTLATKVSGYVSKIGVADNAYVHAGDVIAQIDDGDYRLAVDAARDKVATQEAAVKRIGEQIPAQLAVVDQAKAQLASAQAAAKRWQSELERKQALAQNEFASQQTLDETVASHDQAVANVENTKAVVAAAFANVEVLKAQQHEAARQLQELKTVLAKAERDLSFTVIRAPIDGVIGNRAMHVGDYVQTGQRLASLVPLHDVYVDANFKETQLARLRPGQPVAISVDALPGRDIEGTVASVSPASGSVFSLLPPDNATGNFTKIVQRLTVRISLPESVTDQRLLRPGMSVIASVDTKPGTELAEKTKWSSPSDIPHWQAALR
jgi:membrane fusion protein (multidrug efflux system)